DILVWIAWIKYISWFYYGNEALIINQWRDIQHIDCEHEVSGVGKSTFINAIVNYLSFESMDAANERPICLIPVSFTTGDPQTASRFDISWHRSVEECQRLFNYIKQLPAHKVMDTLSLNNAKQIIQLLTKPLADITKNIADNINQCELHRLQIRGFSGTIDELSKKLYIPSVEIISVPLDRPKTVCGADQCCERKTINDITEVTYTTDCHSPCYLDYSHGNIVGNIGLLSYEQHLHVLYDTCSKMTKVTDQAVDSRIISVRLVADLKEQQILLLDQRMAELIAENNIIVKSMSMFACFLANNALTPINDAFEDYVRHLISNEKHVIAGADTEGSVVRLEQLLQLYRDEKKLINNVIHGPSGRGVALGSNITLKQIDDLVDKLCKLKHKGPYISDTLKLHRQVISDHHFIQNEYRIAGPSHPLVTLVLQYYPNGKVSQILGAVKERSV
ncbi:unnamed protein product, partial [Medioppia subpectinata]